MVSLLSIILSVVFLALSLIHVYWAFGGTAGFDYAIPTDENDKKDFHPGMFITMVVAVGLFVICLFYVRKAGYLELSIPETYDKLVGWVIPSLFLIRGIGDFNKAGLFKKVRNTKFGKADTKYFTPLCIFLAFIGFYVQMG